MPVLREDKGRDYRRYEHTEDEINRLDRSGFTPVLSSNVSAIGEHNGDLYIRFHGGNSYVYPNSGDLYQAMLQSSSKGRFVWNRLRKANVPYRRIANVRLPKDVPSTDINLPEATMEVTSNVLQALVRENAKVMQELDRSYLKPSDVKTLITDKGIFRLAEAPPTQRNRVIDTIYDNQSLASLLLGTIAL
jgi:hypothetical protein